jgi:hypothetical protein
MVQQKAESARVSVMRHIISKDCDLGTRRQDLHGQLRLPAHGDESDGARQKLLHAHVSLVDVSALGRKRRGGQQQRLQREGRHGGQVKHNRLQKRSDTSFQGQPA